MNICVGILGEDARGWLELLAQIGVPCREAQGRLAPDFWSVVVVADDAGETMLASAREYLKEGGALLCSGSVHARLTGAAGDERSVGYLLQDGESGLFPGIGIVDLYATCRVPAGSNAVMANDGRHCVLSGPAGGGTLVALPFDAPELLGDARASQKSFWAERGRLPFERVSVVSRAGIRALVTRALELLHHGRGLPFLHLWYYPGEKPSLFSLRIDTDFATAAEIEPLAALLGKHDIPATWFVHVEGQEELLRFYGGLKGHEIGVHCFQHRFFDREELIDKDISRAEAMLSAAGVPFRGYAGPYGRSSGELARVIARHGFEYSSEFSYDYDNLPSAPASGDGVTPTLQVPVHPISIGNLRRQGCSGEEMRAYFSDVVSRKLRSGSPLFFYHHPKNLHHDVLEHLFSMIREERISPVLLGDYARWWKSRGTIALAAALEGTRLELAGAAPPGDFCCRVTRGDRTEALVPFPAGLDLRSAAWRASPAPLALPAAVGRMRHFNPWMLVNRVEDYLHRKLSF